MKTSVSYGKQPDFDQILRLVKRLPAQDKIKLSKELEREAIDSKLTELLSSFKTDELSEDNILNECEAVRKEIYSKSRGK
jgi:hypothetical protein